MLVERLVQAQVALSYLPPTEESMSRLLVDPVYSRPYSGRYWQAENHGTGEILVSRSLFDKTLSPAPDDRQRCGFLAGAGGLAERCAPCRIP